MPCRSGVILRAGGEEPQGCPAASPRLGPVQLLHLAAGLSNTLQQVLLAAGLAAGSRVCGGRRTALVRAIVAV
jgi:hypothetical protein